MDMELGRLREALSRPVEEERQDALARLFLPPAAKPVGRASELFAERVMARIAEEEAGARRWWRWVDAPWTIPALSLGLAALCLSILLTPPEAVAPMDSLFLLDSQDREMGEWVLPPDPLKSPSLLEDR